MNKDFKELKQKLIERDGLRCSITGDTVDTPEKLAVEHIIPIAEGGRSELNNAVLIKSDLNSKIGRNTAYRTQLILENLQKRENELVAREKELYEIEKKYRNEIEVKTSELNHYRHKLHLEQAEQERKITEEINARKLALENERRIFNERVNSLENDIESEKKSFYEFIKKKELELKEREQEIDSDRVDLEEKRKKYAEETRQKLEKKSSEYVNDALAHLQAKEDHFHKLSTRWAFAGGLAIVCGIALLLWFGVEGLDILKADTEFGWSYLLLVTFKGLILVGLFIALGKYSFMYSQNYMHESIKNSERRHAINFGKFYLESYGATADWNQVKDAFEHWNIECASAFSKQDSSSIDSKSFESTMMILTKALDKMPNSKSA